MTNEKARDFFSAYFEGTLEPGLSVSFEQKLKADENLRDEYRSFVQAMDCLDVLKFEDIHIPEDLHERISARLDRHLYEKKRRAAPAWSSWIRALALAGVGAVAIGGALLFRSGDSASQAGIAPPIAARQRITFASGPEGVTVHFSAASSKVAIVSDERGKELKRLILGADVESKALLSNSLPTPSVFGVQILGDADVAYIAVPGTVRSGVASGEGTVVEFVKSVSDFYRVPVRLESRTPNERMAWKLAQAEPVAEAGKVLGGEYSVTQLASGMLEIEQK